MEGAPSSLFAVLSPIKSSQVVSTAKRGEESIVSRVEEGVNPFSKMEEEVISRRRGEEDCLQRGGVAAAEEPQRPSSSTRETLEKSWGKHYKPEKGSELQKKWKIPSSFVSSSSSPSSRPAVYK